MEESYRVLDKKIKDMESVPGYDSKIHESMTSQRSMLFQELRRLNRLQWEEDHERVDMDED